MPDNARSIQAADSVGQRPRTRVHIRIAARHGIPRLGLEEIWASRELLFFLAWRDVKVRYKQTLLGVLWIILQPVTMILVFSLVLGRVVNLSIPDVPYPIFCLTGLLPWNFLAAVIGVSAVSVAGNAALIQKLYFPRLILPMSSALPAALDFLIELVLIVIFLVYYKTWPTWALLCLPLFFLWLMVMAFGIGLWLAALNVRFRDVPYIVRFGLQTWFFVTPVIYPPSLAPAWLLSLNPMTGILEGFRWSVLGGAAPELPYLAVSAAFTLLVTVGGLYFFCFEEASFADLV